MDLLSWFCQKRFEYHMNWHDLYRRQADTARQQIEYAARNGFRIDPEIIRILGEAERLAEKAWNDAQRWAERPNPE